MGFQKRFEVRTDLALEEKESFKGDGGEISGVSLREWHEPQSRIKMTEVKILDEKGAKSMGKPKGTYITMEAKQLSLQDEGYHREVSGELAVQIRQLLEKNIMENKKTHKNILAVGLGNPSVTPDALGPRVLSNLHMTRHLDEWNKNDMWILSGIVPGVMAQTGMETAEIMKGVIEETSPDILIVIDALAARSIKRLGTTIQLTDSGIHPGSGVGNNRHGLTRDGLGIPVLAIGVPTVVGAVAIAYDTISTVIGMDAEKQFSMIRKLLEPEFGSMYVTPPDIDETIKRLSFTISEGIHQAIAG